MVGRKGTGEAVAIGAIAAKILNEIEWASVDAWDADRTEDFDSAGAVAQTPDAAPLQKPVNELGHAILTVDAQADHDVAVGRAITIGRDEARNEPQAVHLTLGQTDGGDAGGEDSVTAAQRDPLGHLMIEARHDAPPARGIDSPAPLATVDFAQPTERLKSWTRLASNCPKSISSSKIFTRLSCAMQGAAQKTLSCWLMRYGDKLPNSPQRITESRRQKKCSASNQSCLHSGWICSLQRCGRGCSQPDYSRGKRLGGAVADDDTSAGHAACRTRLFAASDARLSSVAHPFAANVSHWSLGMLSRNIHERTVCGDTRQTVATASGVPACFTMFA